MLTNWGKQAPIYVTRKDADGETGTYYISLWMSLLLVMVTFFNAVGWGVYGLVELLSKVI